MNWYSIPPLVASILLLFLAVFIYLKNKRSKLNYLLSLECITSFVWLFSYSMMYLFSYNEKIATYWMRIGYVGVIFIPVFCYHFILEFLGRAKEKIIAYFCYIVTVLFVFLSLKSNLFTNGLIKYFWGYYPRAGVLHPIFLLFFISVIGIGIYHTFIAFIKQEELFQDRRKKERIKYIFLAFLFYTPACVDFIPNYNLAVYPFGYMFSTVFLSMIAYAIIRHQLIDIRIVIKRTLIFAAIFVIAYAALAAFTLLLQSGLEKFLMKHKLSLLPVINSFNINLTPFSISGLILVITCSFLIILILSYGKTKLHRMWALFNIAVGIWGLGTFLSGIVFKETAMLIIWRLAIIGVIFIPVFFYHVICIFCQISRPKTIRMLYLQGVFFLLLDTSDLFLSQARFIFNSFYFPTPGRFYFTFFCIWISLVILGHMELYKFYKSARGVKRNQALYLLLSMFIGFLGGSMNFLLMFGTDLYPWGNFAISIYCVIATYAILRHQLLDIEVIIKKTLLFGGIFAFVYAIFAFFALLGQIFFERFITQNRWIAMIPSVIVVTIMLRPLENFLINVTDKYLFQKKYDYKKLLRTFTSEVLTVLELDKLIKLTEDKLKEIMKLESCEFVFGNISRKMGQSPSQDFVPIFPALKLPISMNNKTMGVLLLGRKKSDEDYTQEDLDILQPLTKTLGIAISNAKLFDELSRTHAKMAEKDKMATVGTLAAGMAHEIRNPITTIRNFADYLPEKSGDAAFMGSFNRLIPNEIDRIENISRSLLEFSMSEDGKDFEEVELRDVVKTVSSLLEPQYRSYEIKISAHCKGRCVIRAKRIQVQDAIFSIMKYIFAESPKASTIAIEIGDSDDGVNILLNNKDLTVAEHIIKDVFEPVSELYREKRGFGFDLFIAKELIERNRGTLKITSGKAAGSEFRIEFRKG